MRLPLYPIAEQKSEAYAVEMRSGFIIPQMVAYDSHTSLRSRCPFRKSSASFDPCSLAWSQVICAAKLAA
jgi:hypothetical protein